MRQNPPVFPPRFPRGAGLRAFTLAAAFTLVGLCALPSTSVSARSPVLKYGADRQNPPLVGILANGPCADVTSIDNSGRTPSRRYAPFYETWLGTNRVEVEASRKITAQLLELFGRINAKQ